MKKQQREVTPERSFWLARWHELVALLKAVEKEPDGPGKDYLWAKIYALQANLACSQPPDDDGNIVERRMSGPASSHMALVKSVSHCTYPGLDATDKALFMYLALFADRGTGANAHPGNRSIADVLCMSVRCAQKRLAKNEERRLIRMAVRGDGRKNATKWTLCIDSPYFPDRTPTGDWLVDNPRPTGVVDSDNEPRPTGVTVNPETATRTATLTSADRDPVESKPRPAEAETATPEGHHIRSTSEAQQQPTTCQPAENVARESRQAGRQAGRDGTDVLSSLSKDQLWKELINDGNMPDEMRKAMPESKERDMVLNQLAAICDIVGDTKKGIRILADAISEWADGQSPPLATLQYHRWSRWLEFGAREYHDAVDMAEYERKRDAKAKG